MMHCPNFSGRGSYKMAKRGELKGNEITPPYGVDFAT
jgi:hypothetical protein